MTNEEIIFNLKALAYPSVGLDTLQLIKYAADALHQAENDLDEQSFMIDARDEEIKILRTALSNLAKDHTELGLGNERSQQKLEETDKAWEANSKALLDLIRNYPLEFAHKPENDEQLYIRYRILIERAKNND